MRIVNYFSIFVSITALTEAAFVGSSGLKDITADVSGSSLPLLVNSQFQFMGNISIGSPAQNLTVLFDISATNLTIYFGKFQPNPSITFTNRPLGGALSANSSVNIAGLNITGQEFIVSMGSNANANIAGVCGLGYSANNSTGMPSPLYNIIANNLMAQQLFSLQLLLTDDTNSAAGTLLLGAVNSTLQASQPIIYADNSNITDWQFNINSSFINGTSTGNASVQLSTNSIAIAVPDAIYQNLSQFLPMQFNESGSYAVNCDLAEPLFVFLIDDSNLTLYAADFMISGNDTESITGSTCVFIVENSGSDVWRLGTPFLAKYYTVYDIAESRIGFVDIKNSSMAEDTSTTTDVTPPATTTGPISTTTKDPGNAAMGSFAWAVYQKIVLVFIILFLLK